MTPLAARIEGVGFWTGGLPSWPDAQHFARDGVSPEAAPARPSPQLLPPNERRRAPPSVAVALQVALEACQASGRDPATLPSVFASTHGELGLTDYSCSTLATDPRSLSPIRFHNSVHNAASGYWTIGTGAMAPSTALSAMGATFAEALLEGLVQLASGEDAVLVVAYDVQSVGPLGEQARSDGLLGAALVLARDERENAPVLQAVLADGMPDAADGPLARHAAGNAMAPMLPLFDALVRGAPADLALDAGPGRVLRVRLLAGADGMESIDA
ncbi:beta-ketoacyl synthase chain length factor [Lysobacter sp. SG-8]|uniref:Beta-ketoacyl synthase chain length factor n=2 Tax=Marilutibacter penaei TaxID=2759900 RepID=A0A7W3U1H9_9GAMM|nr:beta-ketoacyl synthase chain length factor [Lysobacter penaei]MBB1087233.1 beta-ketoacyl synthase chain length factor [Lysobacter penaei]